MLNVITGNANQLTSGLEAALASYRHKVFIETLQWPLPDADGLERDQFDRDDTLYAVAREASGEVCGCARLLPTTRAYLLGEVFPELMNGAPVPHAHDIWELSRFSTMPADESVALPREEARNRLCTLLASVVQTATSNGATRLIMVTVLGVERILRNIGVHAHRAGPPRAIDGKPTLAMWIELDEQTHNALHLPMQPQAMLQQ
jgi:acyl homoserine lactone synthase